MASIVACKMNPTLNPASNKGSDIIGIKVPGSRIYVLNSKEAANELLDQRSSKYSSKPSLTMVNEYVMQSDMRHVNRLTSLYRSGFWGTIPLLPYGNRLKICRRLLQKGLGRTVIESYTPYLNRESAFYLEKLLNTPEKFVKHCTQ